MTTVWVTLGVVAAMNFVMKAAGPVAIGGRDLPPRALGVIALLSPALLSALIVVNTVADDGELVIDARVPGLAAAATAFALRVPLLPAVLIAAAVTAGLRAIA